METITARQPRIKNWAAIFAEAMQVLQELGQVTRKSDVPPSTLGLVHLRASQINGCSACVEYGWRAARKAGEADERLFAVAAWRESTYFSEAERAALALAEAATRLSDRPDPVPDEIWNEAARHYDEQGLASLVLTIATTNFYNRINVTLRQQAGGSWG